MVDMLTKSRPSGALVKLVPVRLSRRSRPIGLPKAYRLRDLCMIVTLAEPHYRPHGYTILPAPVPFGSSPPTRALLINNDIHTHARAVSPHSMSGLDAVHSGNSTEAVRAERRRVDLREAARADVRRAEFAEVEKLAGKWVRLILSRPEDVCGVFGAVSSDRLPSKSAQSQRRTICHRTTGRTTKTGAPPKTAERPFYHGTPGRTRTPNLLIRSQPL